MNQTRIYLRLRRVRDALFIISPAQKGAYKKIVEGEIKSITSTLKELKK